MKKLLLFVLSLQVLSQCSLAQTPAITQVYTNPIYANPAFVGTSNNQRIGLNLEGLWPYSSENSSISYGVSYDRNIIDSNFGIGGTIEQAGTGRNDLILSNSSLILSYQFHLKSFTLSAGLQSTLGRDFSAGALAYGENYFVGLTINPLSLLSPKLVVNGGLLIHNGEITISPTLLYLYQQHFHEVMLQCYITYKKFVGGIGDMFNTGFGNDDGYNFNSQGDALSILLGYQNKYLRAAYSYDYYLGSQLAHGAHEVSLAFFVPYKSAKLKKISGLNCPML